MKTTLAIVVLFLAFVETQAQEQIKRGVYSFGGSVSYSYSRNYFDDQLFYKISTITISPNVTYFIVDNVELSASFGYSQTDYDLLVRDNKLRTLSSGLGLRYYFSASNTLAPFIGAGGLVMWNTLMGGAYSTPQWTYNVIGGLEIFVAQSVAIEPSISYSKIRTDSDASSIGIQFGIGAKYFIL